MIKNPYFDAGMRGWLSNTARANYRRIASYSYEDLLQEGHICFLKCYDRYVGKGAVEKRGVLYRALPDTPDEEARKHFMGLVKRSFSNRIFDLVGKFPAHREVVVADMVPSYNQYYTDRTVWESLLPSEDEVATVSDLIRTAPAEVLQLFELLISDACDTRPYRRIGRRRFKKRETNARYWGRLLDLPPGVDVVKQLERHFLLQ